MQTSSLSLRTATERDIAAVDALLARSYPRLLKAHYPPSVMVTAVPLVARANPVLVASGRYIIAELPGGGVAGAGGWSVKGRSGVAEVRHVATDPDHLRQGVGRRLLDRIIGDARAAGIGRLDCLATLTAEPFYAALGFRSLGRAEIGLAPGIGIEVVRMWRAL